MPNHVTNKIVIQGVTPKRAATILCATIGMGGRFDFNAIIPMPNSLQIESSSTIELLADALQGKLPSWSKDESPQDAIERIKKQNPEIYENTLHQAKLAIKNVEKYGCRDWYDWSYKKWGTKWNAYQQHFDFEDENPVNRPKYQKRKNLHVYRSSYLKRLVKKRIKQHFAKYGECSVSFQTAWSMPEPIFRTWSELFPDATIYVKYADEDVGANCGVEHYKDGEIIYQDIAGKWGEMSDDDKKKWRKFAFDFLHNLEDATKEERLSCLEDYGMDENYNYIDD